MCEEVISKNQKANPLSVVPKLLDLKPVLLELFHKKQVTQ